LLSASAVLCLLPPGAGGLTIDEVSGAIAALDIATIEETPEKVSA
jgi:hypothetical protein